MLHLQASRISGPIDLTKITAIVDLSSEIGSTSFLVHVFTEAGRLAFMLQNADPFLPPSVYMREGKLIILSGYSVLSLDPGKLELGAHEEPIFHLVEAAREVPGGLLILHQYGCTLLSDDLSGVLWRIDDPRIVSISVEGDHLRVFFGQHQSVLVSLLTGNEVDDPIATFSNDVPGDDTSNVIFLKTRQR